jgi:hypothetical protein
LTSSTAAESVDANHTVLLLEGLAASSGSSAEHWLSRAI